MYKFPIHLRLRWDEASPQPFFAFRASVPSEYVPVQSSFMLYAKRVSEDTVTGHPAVRRSPKQPAAQHGQTRSQFARMHFFEIFPCRWEMAPAAFEKRTHHVARRPSAASGALFYVFLDRQIWNSAFAKAIFSLVTDDGRQNNDEQTIACQW